MDQNSSNLAQNLDALTVATTQRELTFGEKAAGISFNPSNLPDVDAIKQVSAQFIDFCNAKRALTESGEAKRYYSKAISYLEDAQMNAVKALTWRG